MHTQQMNMLKPLTDEVNNVDHLTAGHSSDEELIGETSLHVNVSCSAAIICFNVGPEERTRVVLLTLHCFPLRATVYSALPFTTPLVWFWKPHVVALVGVCSSTLCLPV